MDVGKSKTLALIQRNLCPIGGNGVWLFLTGGAQDGMAIKPGTPVEKYFLKLHWGKTFSNAAELSDTYSVADFKEGIEWLVSANGTL